MTNDDLHLNDTPPPPDATPPGDVAPPTADHDATVSALVPPMPAMRVGFVALVGKPNVGKSTLLNGLLGQKVAIVSHRPQTTRVPLRGIVNRADAQVIFIDTPGIHQAQNELGRFMVRLAQQAIPNADVVCMMVDISKPPSRLDISIAQEVRRARIPRLLVLNKVDLPGGDPKHVAAFRELGEWDMEIAVSALKGKGLAGLMDEIVARLPQGIPLYPTDWLTDQQVQYLAGEMVREQILKYTNQEVPHAVAVEVEEWDPREHVIYVRMTIYVERDSQKGIIIGAGGVTLKRIGQAARRNIEQLTDQQIYLDLHVKTRPNWRNDTASMGWLGYRYKDWQ